MPLKLNNLSAQLTKYRTVAAIYKARTLSRIPERASSSVFGLFLLVALDSSLMDISTM